MKNALRRGLAIVLLFALSLMGPDVALAETSASNYEELAAILTEAGLKRETSVKVKYTGDYSDVDNLIPIGGDFSLFYTYMAMHDDPTTSDDADYLVGSMCYSNDFYIDYRDGNLLFTMDYFETLEQTTYVNEHVHQILDELGVANMSNYEKVRTIHDYVCELITYTNTGKYYENCAYGAIKYGKALCNAYSLCLYKLLVEAGIPCKYIGGFAGIGRDAGGHAWNIAALGDKWYFIDATWDDTDDKLTYDYFLRGLEDFDESDPAQGHWMEPTYYRSPYKDVFPIANEGFEEGDDDENRLITIAGTNPGNPDSEISYDLDEIVYGYYPYKRSFTARVNKMTDLIVFLNDKRAATLVTKVSFKVTKGSDRIKKKRNYGLLEDDDMWYTDLEFYGKKKGKVTIDIRLQLVNGKTKKITFKGKVK